MESLIAWSLAWLLTYAVHSTVLLGLVLLCSRLNRLSIHTLDRCWKVALLGGLLTTTAQLSFDVRPFGTLALESTRSTRGQDPIADVRPPIVPNAAPATPGATTKTDAATISTFEAASASNGAEKTTGRGVPAMRPAQQRAAAVLLAAWVVIAFGLALNYVARRLMLVGRLANRQTVTDGALPSLLATLRSTVGFRGRVTLTSVNTISSPIALGLREICVPEAALTQLTVDEQRGLLAHELAHLARRDPIWLDAAALLERVFFFQPLHRIARREIQRNAEFLCDDWAAERTGNGLSLAHCLARVAEWMEASPLGVPVTGMAEQRSLLVTRITRLIEGKRATSPLSRALLLGGAVVALSGVVGAAPGVRLDAPVTAAGLAQRGDSMVDGTGASPRRVPTTDAAGSGKDGNAERLPAERASADDATRDEAHRAALEHAVVPSDAQLLDSNMPVSDADADTRVADDPAVIAALIDRLTDSDAGVRRAAANALGNLRSRTAVPALITASGDRNKDVRMAACNALGEIGDPRAINALVRRLSDESAEVRNHAIDALGEFASELSTDQVAPSTRDGSTETRVKAAELLGEIGDRTAIAVLHPLLGDPSPDVRVAVIESLTALKAVMTEREVSALLADSDPDVRRAALEYVEDHPDVANVAQLRRLLDDVDAEVRGQAVDALAEVRTADARSALRAALSSSDAAVRRRAAEALGERP